MARKKTAARAKARAGKRTARKKASSKNASSKKPAKKAIRKKTPRKQATRKSAAQPKRATAKPAAPRTATPRAPRAPAAAPAAAAASAPRPAAPAGASPGVAAAVPVRVGIVTHYFAHVNAGVIALDEGDLRVGDTVQFRGHTTDFYQRLEHMEVDHRPIDVARAGQAVGVQVAQRVREHDQVFRVSR